MTPWNAVDSAGPRPVRAASAVRTLARTATLMPMKPAAAEALAPIRNPIAVVQLIARPSATAITIATGRTSVY